MHATPTRPRLRPVLGALPLLLVLLVALPAAALTIQVETVTTSPEVPTWQDRVEVRIAGTGTCPVAVSDVRRAGDTVTVELSADCFPPPPPQLFPFRFEVPLDRLAPDVYTLRVEADGARLARTGFIVRQPGSLRLDLPDGPVASDERLFVTVSGSASCPHFDVLAIDDGVAALTFRGECPILPPPARPFNTVLDLGRLDPGLWEIRIFEGDDGPSSAIVRESLRIYDADGCVPDATGLCLQGSRFRVEARWEDFQGGAGDARAIPLEGRDDTGMFWFFSPDNVELTVKVLDGCGVNGHHWVFVAPGSTTGWEVTVTDTLEDSSRTYANGSGELPALVADTTAFARCP